MKILLLAVLVSFGSFARDNCETTPYTKEYIDYDSSLNDSCEKMLAAFMKDNNCQAKTVEKLPYASIATLIKGSSMMCVYEAEGGIYQVMASQMAEPHRAIIMFSVWD
ncbi:MAG: hypothetical protein KC478_15870 [Bacteriovoracaceae bacterium]|nr:hypothetical protein [Bacteriovoracaceae bacterium]